MGLLTAKEKARAKVMDSGWAKALPLAKAAAWAKDWALSAKDWALSAKETAAWARVVVWLALALGEWLAVVTG